MNYSPTFAKLKRSSHRRARAFRGSFNIFNKMYFDIYKVPALVVAALALAAFLLGLHHGGEAVQTIAFLVFLPAFAFFLLTFFLLTESEYSVETAWIMTPIAGAAVWILLDLLGFVILPSRSLENLIGLSPFGPPYRLIEALTGVNLLEAGRNFWVGL